jgi:Flp pilus assembly protein TadG
MGGQTMRRTRHEDRGQALVEFSLSLLVFLMLMMAVFDLGRGIYMYNGVAQAAREIARVTSNYPGSTLGGSSKTAEVLDTQRSLIPNLQNPTYACVDIDDTPITGVCKEGYRVKVTITAPYGPVTPLMSLAGTWTMSSTSSVEISTEGTES